jgi:uncharacterized membrane protein YbhN (UPF0104 family)
LAKRNLWLGLILGVIIYFALTVWGDFDKVLAAISSFHMEYIPVLLALAFANYLLRALKWHYFLKVPRTDISFKENLWVFFSGLLMSVTPGKFGELWRSWLIRDLRGYDLHRTMPIVFMDRITDIVAMLTLASFGVYVFNFGILSFSMVAAILMSMLIVLRSKSIMLKILDLSDRFESIRKAYLSCFDLLCLKPLVLAVLISLVAWFMECLAFYLTFQGLSVKAGLFESTFIYAVSSIAGAATMMPGGLGVTEASLTGLSRHLIMLDESTTVAATIIIRTVTLWFAVGVGALSYFLGRRLLFQGSA